MMTTNITRIFVPVYFLASSTLLVNGQDNYPIPVKTDHLLFYFQRSHNKNTVVYELNTLPDGNINTDKPVNAYWIRYEERGQRAELSFIQRRAFGISCNCIDKEKGSYLLHFNNFKKKDIYLIKTVSNVYRAMTSINGEIAQLDHLYIKSENNALGFPLAIKYVEIYGTTLNDKLKVSERIIP
jgi:hypothetical protein